jgi:hypothetical protein
MPKSILEELEALVGKDNAAKIAANSDISTRLSEGERLFRYYTGQEDDPDLAADAAKAAADKAAADKAAADKAEADRRAAAAAPAATDNKAILGELSNLLTTRFSEFEKKVVTIDKLPQYEGELLAKTLRLSHDISRIESNHEKEFGEQLDLDKFNTWYDEQKKVGAAYGSVAKAYDVFVGDRRIEAKIKAGVEEGVKAKLSSTSVPAQTMTESLSPAQTVLREARKTTASEGKSNAVKAAERLAQLQKEREGTAA